MNKSIIIFVSVFLLAGCSAIFEENIEKSQVSLVAPQNNLTSDKFTQFFYWNEVEDALGYNLQIAEPNFDNIQYILLDTNVQTTSYEFTLAPGTYQWRVKAYNGSSETTYSTFTLTIDSNPDLSNQQVNLLQPTNGMYSNDSSVTFSWQPLATADNYQFELHTPDFNGSQVFDPILISDTALTKTLQEGEYGWGVRAQNSLSNTLFSTRTFTIDYTAPATPTLTSPVNNDTLQTGSSLTFQWGGGQDGGSPITDSLFISSDSLDWSGAMRYASTNLTVGLDSLPQGNYYWQVFSIDAATNQSPNSITNHFTIEE